MNCAGINFQHKFAELKYSDMSHLSGARRRERSENDVERRSCVEKLPMAARRKSTKNATGRPKSKVKATSAPRPKRERGSESKTPSSKKRGKVAVKRQQGTTSNAVRKRSEAVSVAQGVTKSRARSAKATTGAKSSAKIRASVGRPRPKASAANSNSNRVEAKLRSKNDQKDEIALAARGASAANTAMKALAEKPPTAGRSSNVSKPEMLAGKDQKSISREEPSAAPKTSKPTTQRQGFKLNEFVVYPAHGVGQIIAIEDQEVAGFKLELFVISFSKDKMILRVPTAKVAGVGMRKISDAETAKRSLDILTGRARVKRTMWSRRAQEYETKINSGDIGAIAEVVRDLYRSDAQPEQSYSERQLYEAALDRMVREIAAVQKSNEIDALRVVEAQLQKSHGRTSRSSVSPAEASDPEVEEAA